MKSDEELQAMIDRLGQEITRLGLEAKRGEKATAELAHFRAAFGLAPEVDLVAEFDRRSEAADWLGNQVIEARASLESAKEGLEAARTEERQTIAAELEQLGMVQAAEKVRKGVRP